MNSRVYLNIGRLEGLVEAGNAGLFMVESSHLSFFSRIVKELKEDLMPELEPAPKLVVEELQTSPMNGYKDYDLVHCDYRNCPRKGKRFPLDRMHQRNYGNFDTNDCLQAEFGLRFPRKYKQKSAKP